jgi:hypothetical protein
LSVYGSFSDHKIYKRIIDQVGNEFVNICQSPGSLEIGMMAMNIDFKCNEEIFELPLFASNESLIQILMRDSITHQDLKKVDEISDLIAKAFENLQINEENIGSLIVPLPEV